MPISTYVPLFTTTLGSNSSSVTLGSGGTIPQIYKDLILTISGGGTNATDAMFVEFNGDTTSGNYFLENITGSTAAGTQYAKHRTSNLGWLFWGTGVTADLANTLQMHINSYSSTAFSKTCLIRDGGISYNELTIGLYTPTAAITQIRCYSTNNWLAGTTFTLHGIAGA